MENTLNDLNNYLFESIERLNDDSLSDEELQKELLKADATSKIAKNIIDNGNLMIKSYEIYKEQGRKDVTIPLLGVEA